MKQWMTARPVLTAVSCTGLIAVGACLFGCSASEGERPSRSVEGLVLIDDFEDANNQTLNDPSGYNGYWYTFNDQCGGMQWPAEGDTFTMTRLSDGPANMRFAEVANAFGARTHGDAGFIQWGAGMGVDLNLRPDQTKGPFDASEFAGIGFWGLALDRPVNVALNVHEARTSQEASPLLCTPVPNPECGEPFGASTTPNKCDDHFYASAVLSPDDWKWCSFSWEDLHQPDYVPAADALGDIDTSQLYALQFKVGALVAFDFVIDNVAFLEEVPERDANAPRCVSMSEL